jgi:hypothetical protein
MDRREALCELGTLLGAAIIPAHLPISDVSSAKQNTDVTSKSTRKRNLLSENWKF